MEVTVNVDSGGGKILKFEISAGKSYNNSEFISI